MAAAGSMYEVRPIEPRAEKVATPTESVAPNYVEMYSQAIHAALEPYNYLLNYRKELSEEDVQHAQIQRILQEHGEKMDELDETAKSHRADEAQKALELEATKARYTAEEAHNKVLEGIEGDRNSLERDRINIERLRQQRDDAHATWEENWKLFDESRENKKLDIEQADAEAKKSVYESEQARNHADLLKTKTETDRLTDESNNRARDELVLRDLQTYVNGLNRQDLYGRDDHPEIQDKLNELHSMLKTDDGRRRAEDIIGHESEVGRELFQRQNLMNMPRDARDKFVHVLTNENPDQDDSRWAKRDDWDQLTPRQKFAAAYKAAQETTERHEQMYGYPSRTDKQGNVAPGKEGWSSEAIEKYQMAKRAHKSDDDAYQEALKVQEDWQLQQKQKEAIPKPVTGTALKNWNDVITNPNVSDTRKAQLALELDKYSQDTSAEGQTKFQQLYNEATGTTSGTPASGGGTTTPSPGSLNAPSSNSFIQGIITGGTTMLSPGQGASPMQPAQLASTFPSQAIPNYRVAQSEDFNADLEKYLGATGMG